MLQFVEVVSLALPPTDTLTLSWDSRQKSRALARLDSGAECGLMLPRGTVLQDGDLLRAETGILVRVVAAAEMLSVGYASDIGSLLRAAYHLGNRHVPVELHPSRLAYQQDHVLDVMVRELGLRVSAETLPFAPESGAYRSHAASGRSGERGSGGGHSAAGHGHAHGHGHGHGRGGHGHG